MSGEGGEVFEGGVSDGAEWEEGQRDRSDR